MTSRVNEALDLAHRLEDFLSHSSGTLEALDQRTRHKLSETSRNLNLAMESAGDTVNRLIYSPLQLPLTVIGLETHLFETLAERGRGAVTNAELANITKIDPVLTKRLLRYYQSFGMIDQLTDDQYSANSITSAVVSRAGRVGVPLYFEVLVPVINALPQFLRNTKYADITDVANCPWYLGQKTDKQLFEWVKERPNVMNLFLSWMECQRDGLPTFLETMDFEKEFAGEGTNETTPVFVDIGGAMGHQCVALRQKHPNIAGRLILQDQEEVIQRVKTHPILGFEGIETQSHDFFTPQPIKGARAYYMRNILHDWPDHMCVEILKNIKPAMSGESRILIDEMVLPERGAPWRATQLDFLMSACVAAVERSRADWDALLAKAELKILKVWKYTEELDDCVIIAVPN